MSPLSSGVSRALISHIAKTSISKSKQLSPEQKIDNKKE